MVSDVTATNGDNVTGDTFGSGRRLILWRQQEIVRVERNGGKGWSPLI